MVRAALVGLGRIGSLLEKDALREKPATHAAALVDNPEITLVAGVDPVPERRRNFRETWKVESVYETCQALFKHHPLDLLHLATPVETHLSLLEAAIKQNIPVVVLEKPVCLLEELPRAAALAEQLHPPPPTHSKSAQPPTRVVVNHERRFAADYLFAKKLVHTQRYGPLRSVQAALHLGRKTAPAQSLFHDGTHLLDLLRYLTGAATLFNTAFPLHLRSTPVGETLEQWELLFNLAEIPIHLELGPGRNYLYFGLTLNFEAARLAIGNGFLSLEVSGPSPYYEKCRSLLPVEGPPHAAKTYYFKNMLRHAVDLVKHPTWQSHSSLMDGLAPLYFLQQVLKQKGGAGSWRP